MSEDPFDFGLHFQSAADRIVGERDERLALAARALSYGVPLLDDQFRALMPHDLVLLGAATGAGKTQLAMTIAAANAAKGKNVHFFALEAEPGEIERRLKFRELMRVAGERNVIRSGAYPDWYIDTLVGPIRDLEADAESSFRKRYATLQTYYRGSNFLADDVRRLLLAIQSETDLIVIDHLHYIDLDDDNENRGLKKVVKVLRDTSISIGRPVLLVAHLRKRNKATAEIVPDIDDFMGSSDVAKICTQAVLLAPARGVETKPGMAATYMTVAKDRRGGVTGHVALSLFSRSLGAYEGTYRLGWSRGDAWEPCAAKDVPSWAKNHVGGS